MHAEGIQAIGLPLLYFSMIITGFSLRFVAIYWHLEPGVTYLQARKAVWRMPVKSAARADEELLRGVLKKGSMQWYRAGWFVLLFGAIYLGDWLTTGKLW